jgi:hypothetical protein
MNSPLIINYDLRPAKFTERKMLLAVLTKICAFYDLPYQYIGFGGLDYTDFKLFHKELHIDKMISIEGGDKISEQRTHFNRPYDFIDLKYDFSTNALSKIDLSKKSIVWLDYDGRLDKYFFEDLELLFSKLPKGSVYIVTCNRELKDMEEGFYSVEKFKADYENLLPFDISKDDLSGVGNFQLIRKMLTSLIEKKLKEREYFETDKLKFKQLFHFLYNENNGANMYTFGGVITDEDFDINFNNFEFVKNSTKEYRLKIPHLTIKEINLIDSCLNTKEEELDNKIIAPDQLDKYKRTYKYLPNYLDVRK